MSVLLAQYLEWLLIKCSHQTYKKFCTIVIRHLFEIPLVHKLKKIKLLLSIGILICSNKLEKKTSINIAIKILVQLFQ